MPLAPIDAKVGDDDAVLIEAVSDFARTELLSRDRAWDKDESSVAEVLDALSGIGLLNLLVPTDLGGLGCCYRTYAAILHELARYSPSTCVTIGVHSMVGRVLDKGVEEPMRSEWLSRWGHVESLSAFCLSEAGAGSDASAAKAESVEIGGGFRITGEKMWVTNGLTARWFLTMARRRDGSESGLPCAYLVDGESNGIERTKISGKMGIRGSETAVITFDETFVPASHRLGKPGSGLDVFLAGLNGGRIGIAAQATGIAEACLDEMVAYARQREQFGRPIGDFAAIAEMIADSRVELEAAKALVWRAADEVDACSSNRSSSSMAKLYASEAANKIAYRAVQVHGGAGYVNDCRVEQLFRDARITSIYEGTSEIQRIVIARQLAAAS